MGKHYLTYDDLKQKIEEAQRANMQLSEAINTLQRLSYWPEEKEALSKARAAAGNITNALLADAARTLKSSKKPE